MFTVRQAFIHVMRLSCKVQMSTPSQHDHDMMFGGVMVPSTHSTPPPDPESGQTNNNEGYTTVARFLADEDAAAVSASARDGMEVHKIPSVDMISEKVTRVIPMENFPVATNESLESLQELSARGSSNEPTVFEMDVIPEEGESESRDGFIIKGVNSYVG